MNNESFIKSLFTGDIKNNYIFPYPELTGSESDTVSMKLDTLLMAFDEDKSEYSISAEDRMNAKKMGLAGFLIPKMYKGYGMNNKMMIKILENLSSHKVIIPLKLLSFGLPCVNFLSEYGNEKQKIKYLSKIASGDMICSFSIYDKDIKSIEKTTAVKTEDEKYYSINGEKVVINAENSNLFLIFARAEDDLSCFIVEKSYGVEIESLEKSNSNKTINKQIIKLNNIKVPVENKIANKNDTGVIKAFKMVSLARFYISATYFAVLKDISEKLTEHRKIIGNELFDEHKREVINIKQYIFVLESMLYTTASLIDNSRDYSLETSITKLYSRKAVSECLETYFDMTADEESIPFVSIIDELNNDSDKIFSDEAVINYVVSEGLEAKHREIKSYIEDSKNSGKMVSENFNKFGNVVSNMFSTLAEGLNIITSEKQDPIKTKELMSNFNKLKEDISDFNSTVRTNTKKLWNIGLQNIKNIKEDVFTFLPNDFVGMTNIKKISTMIGDTRAVFSIYLNRLRQRSRHLLQEYKSAMAVPNEDRLKIYELAEILYAMAVTISKTDMLIKNAGFIGEEYEEPIDNDENKERARYYIRLMHFFTNKLKEERGLSSELLDSGEYESEDELIDYLYKKITGE